MSWWANAGTKGRVTGNGGCVDIQNFNFRTLLRFKILVVHGIDCKVVEDISARFGATNAIRSLSKTNNELRK